MSECPGPGRFIEGPLRDLYTGQWERTGKEHWWRFNWDIEANTCKFCHASGPRVERLPGMRGTFND